MSTISMVTVEDLRARRAELLQRAGMPEVELRRRGDMYKLSLKEIEILDELDEIDYLLSR